MAISRAKVAIMVECQICLDSFHDPKQLNCGHTYCKDCLDNILRFNKDGSAVIPCPLNCENSVFISKDETTKSLSTNYTINGFIELLNEEENVSEVEKQHYHCKQTEGCKRFISSSCSICSMKTCKECQREHCCQQAFFTPVICNKNSGMIEPLCKTHESLAKYVCTNCENKFVCVYCLHREHKNHKTVTLNGFGLKVKNCFQSHIISFDEVKDFLQDLSTKYLDAFKSLNAKREEFVNELKVRKLKRMEQYLFFLNVEEDKLVEEFDEKVKDFKLKVSTAGFDVMDNLCAKMKDFSEYMNQFQAKYSFELIAEKLEIEKNFRNLTSLPSVAPRFGFELGEMDCDEFTKSTLGQIKISVKDVNIAGNDIDKVVVEKTCIMKTRPTASYKNLKQGLECLLAIVLEYDVSSNSTVHKGVEVKSTKKKKTEMTKSVQLPVTKSYSFEELVQIIRNNDITALRTILNSDTSIGKMRNWYTQETLLMKAASSHVEKEIVKVLIGSGSELWAENRYGMNAYHYSALHGHHEILKILIDHDDININHPSDTYKQTPLHLASQYDNVECVKLLLSIPHVDIDVTDACNKTAYDCCRDSNIKRLIAAHKNM